MACQENCGDGWKLLRVSTEDSEASEEASEAGSVASSDQDLEAVQAGKHYQPHKPSSPPLGPIVTIRPRTRTSSTLDKNPVPSVHHGLLSRGSFRKALRWLEGADNDAMPSVTEEPALQQQDPELVGDARGHLFPVGLVSALIVGAACMLTLHRHCVASFLGPIPSVVFSLFTLCIFALIFGCMAYAGLIDPGQLPDDVNTWPERSHKSWQYARPIMRYDHYCRWILNAVALKNHREFVVMLIAMVSVVILGVVVDIVLFCWSVGASHWALTFGLVLHCAYSFALGYYVIPIFRLHISFVSRNELCQEWKNDLFYVVDDRLTGSPVWVGDLDQDEFTERYDTFRYDPSRNQWDKGCMSNCLMFWCTSRGQQHHWGEF